MSCRGRALECLGHVAVAIGPTNFAPYFEMGMQSAAQGLTLDISELSEHSYVYFANSAKVMQDQFSPYVEGIMPKIIEMIGQTELIFGGDDDDDDDEDETEEVGLEASFEDDDDDDGVRINGLEGFINNKSSAIISCSALAEHVSAATLPHLDTIINKLLEPGTGAVYSYHGAIRGEVFEAFPAFLKCVAKANGLPPACKKGEMMQLPQAVAEMVRIGMQVCLEAMEDDEEKKPVAQAIEAVSAMLEQVGGAALTGTDDKGVVIGQRLLEAVLKFLKEKSACQLAKAEIEEDADDEDHDFLVMDSVTDLIGVLAKALGPSFLPHFDVMLQPLLKFTRPSRVHTDRSMALGCLSEVVENTGPDCIKYADMLLQLFPEGMRDSQEGVRRNCAFGLGCFVAATGTALSSHLMQFLQWLQPLCVRANNDKLTSDAGGADTDNALSAVSHIIRAAPQQLPLNLVLPVMFAALPLRVDELEGINIYGCFLELLSSQVPAAVELAPSILTACAVELNSSLTTSTKELKQHIVGGLKSLMASPAHSAMMTQAVAAVPREDLRQTISMALSS